MSSKSKKQTRTATGRGSRRNLEVILVDADSSSKIEKRNGGFSVRDSAISGFTNIGGFQVENPPFAIDDWALAPEVSTRLSACIFIRSTNTAGLGYEIVPNKQSKRKLEVPTKELSDDEKKERQALSKIIEEETDKIETLLDNPHPVKSFARLFKSIIADRLGIGNGYMNVKTEIVPKDEASKTEPEELDRIVGHTVRMKVRGGFVAQLKKGKFKHYKDWGDPRLIDSRTGKVHKPGMGLLAPQYHATELIHFKIDSARDTEYGVPMHLSTGPAIAGNRFAAERNASFFENDAVPRLAIVVTGPQRLSKGSREDIKNFLERKNKGSTTNQRVMIIQAGKKEGSLSEGEKVDIKFEKLTVGISEEGSYLKYQDKTKDEVAESMGIHPVFFEKDATKASMNVGRSITLDQTFEPDIVDYEYIINNTIVKRLGVTHVAVRLNRPKTLDFEGQAGILKKLERTGGITPNDVRIFLNKPKFKANWADLPLPLAMQVLKVPAERAERSELIDDLLAIDEMVDEEMKKRMENLEDEDLEEIAEQNGI